MPKLRPLAVRRLIAMAVVLIGAVVFSVRLVDLQVVQAPKLNAEALDKRGVPVTVPSLRGDIVDRNGVVLAATDERYDVQLSPKNVRLNGGKFWPTPDKEVSAEEAFAQIGAITGQAPEEIAQIVDDALAENPKSDFAYVKRGVDLTALNALKKLLIPWITFDVNHERVYPNGAVAGSMVGFIGSEGQPQAGIELSQDECLVGVDGEETYEKGADGVRLPGSVVVTKAAQNGGTVQLTIDRDLQYEVQQAINKQVESSNAEWGLTTVLDVKTGELLAVAEDHSVDPNNVDGVSSDYREARSFTYPYEPGSTFKTLTAAALIDQGAATIATQNYTPFRWDPEPGVTFADSTPHADMPWTLAGIIVESSNVGISMLGSRLDEQTRYDYLKKFGIGEETHAGMPLESAGMFTDASEWDRQTNYNTMFGQGLSSTIIQTASAYQAIANGGVRLPPVLVKSCTAADGKVTETKPEAPVQVISAEAAAETRKMLEAMATEGWVAEDAAIAGYRLGGKTGTAEQSDGEGGYRPDYVYTFAGMFPMDDPQYVVVSTVAYPKSPASTIVAVRAWHASVEATIRTFHVPPSSGAYEPLQLTY
jgi:cell division protein FtsI (penicillin-binding protein 3)